ncbi:hypothetical protein [Pedobacter aquatilis]|uniref:hypothetical protein n=1 Tax=Pedobacter aquatilis TaxID=351343 RepID=UPI00292E16C6|nr:hypothetical protein [Pedobacter aquatilis]
MKASRHYILGQNNNKLITQIKFASAPSSAVATVPNLKFNKKNWFSFELDDASVSLQSALNIFNQLFYTDGCGNNINYRLGLALNGASNYSGLEEKYDGSNPSQTTVQVINQILVAGGDLSDHSYFHEPEGYGAGVTPLENTIRMQDYILRKFNGYKVRSKAVPTNYEGHATAAYNQGYLYSTSTGTFDNFTPVGLYTPLGDFGLVPTFGALRRAFTDSWVDSYDEIKTFVDTLLTKENWFLRLGSHGIDNLQAFTNYFNYIKNQSNDRLLVSTTREIFEYREMKNLPITQNLVGDTLTIEVDLTNLSNKNRWKDLSFNVNSNSTIQSVTSNATSASFNSSTGLVNIFKQTY